MNKADQETKMELWRRAADPKCDLCYGRGYIMRIIPAPMNVTNQTKKRMIDRCQCTEKKKDLAQRINDGDMELKPKYQEGKIKCGGVRQKPEDLKPKTKPVPSGGGNG